MSLVNNMASDNVRVYVTGLDGSGAVVLLLGDGTFYYPPDTSSATPVPIPHDVSIPLGAQGSTTSLSLPDYIYSARVWFADGNLDFQLVSTKLGPALVEPTVATSTDPSYDVNWGFIELTYDEEQGLFANLSFVDFVGLPIGMQLATPSGTQYARGMPSDAVASLCSALTAQSALDNMPWKDLCVMSSSSPGTPLRIVSPYVLAPTINDSSPSGPFTNYFDTYVDSVFSSFTSSSTSLTINTQTSLNNVTCTSDGTTLVCEGDNRAYAKPTAKDILGCNSGPFAIADTDNLVHRAVVPRLCAAFNRATFLLPGGDLQPSLPPSAYYPSTEPSNWYSAFVHQIEIDGRGYAFAYDDVAPSTDEEVAGVLSSAEPGLLTIFVGGYS